MMSSWLPSRTKFGGDPVAYGPGSYDAATILLQAADRVATVDADGNLVIGRKALADSIRATPFTGSPDTWNSIEVGDLKAASITVFQVQDGRHHPAQGIHLRGVSMQIPGDD